MEGFRRFNTVVPWKELVRRKEGWLGWIGKLAWFVQLVGFLSPKLVLEMIWQSWDVSSDFGPESGTETTDQKQPRLKCCWSSCMRIWMSMHVEKICRLH